MKTQPGSTFSRSRFSRNQNSEGNEQAPQEMGNVPASGPVYLVYLVYFVGLVGRTGKSTRGIKENRQMSKEPWGHCRDLWPDRRHREMPLGRDVPWERSPCFFIVGL